MKKKVISIILSAMMLLSVAGCGQESVVSTETTQTSETAQTSESTQASETTVVEESAYPEYINMDSYYPLVKDGTDVTLDITLIVSSNFSENPMDRWFWHAMEEYMGVDINVTQISTEGAAEYINTSIFGADDVPDILFTATALTTDQLVKYGMTEGQLLDMSPYMTDATLMPNLNALYDRFPELKANITFPDGGMYSQVVISDNDGVGIYNKRQMNTPLLDSMGYSVETLDDFVDALYAVKAANEDMTPLGGAYEKRDPSGIILNALGYNESASSSLYNVAVRNGVPVVPAADREAFGEYLTIMNGFFNDEIIHRDYFTQDLTAAGLVVEEGNTVVNCAGPHPKGWEEGYGVVPALTSDYSTTAVIGQANLYKVGNVVVSAETEYPELIARLLDYLYSDEGHSMFRYGPCVTQTEFINDTYKGWALTDANAFTFEDVNNGTWENQSAYCNNVISAGPDLIGCLAGQVQYWQTVFGRDIIKSDYDNWVEQGTASANAYWRVPTYDTYKPVATQGLPNLYFDADTSDSIADLKSVIENHMRTEVPKFINGTRPLTELEAYFDELDALGYQEYIGYYQDAYDVYLSNLG